MSDLRPPDGKLAETMGRLDANITRLIDDVKTLQANAVTKEMLEAKIGPQQRIFWALVTLVILAVASAVVSGVVKPQGELPKVEIILPTASPVGP